MAYDFRNLELDWITLCSSQEASRALNRWSQDPALNWAGRLSDFCGLNSGPVTDERLLALASRAPEDETAARVLLQAMVPGLRRIARLRGHQLPASEVDAQLMALCWERIVTYPCDRRPRAVASNILLDTRRNFTRWVLATRTQARPNDHLTIALRSDDCQLEETSVARLDIATGKSRAANYVNTAVIDGVLSRETADTIIRTRIDGEALRLVAESLGISYVAARARRSRGERRLAQSCEYPMTG